MIALSEMFAIGNPGNEMGDATFPPAPEEQEPVDVQGWDATLAALLRPWAAGEEPEINSSEGMGRSAGFCNLYLGLCWGYVHDQSIKG